MMTFTDKDKMLARKYREAGYNYVIRDRDGSVLMCVDLPKKSFYGLFMFWIVYKTKRIDKRNFKPVQFSDSEPTRLDDIIGE